MILALAVVLGGMVGVMFVLIRSAVRNRKAKLYDQFVGVCPSGNFPPTFKRLIMAAFLQTVRKLNKLLNYFRYKQQKNSWLSRGGKITHNYMILGDYQDKAGFAKDTIFIKIC